jgi:antitoxin ParD1/3/4
MKIKLNYKQEKFVETQVNNGKFATVDEVVNLALQLLEKMGGEYDRSLEETREKVDAGWAELDRGEGLDGETVVMEILERFKVVREKADYA